MEILKLITKALQPFDSGVTLFVRVRYYDDTEDDKLIETTRDQVDVLMGQLVDRCDVKEAWVFEQLHHHKKACATRTKSTTGVLLPLAE